MVGPEFDDPLSTDAPSKAELREWMEDLIIDARRFDSLSRDARSPHSVAPVTESDAPVFREEAFKARRHARGIYRYLHTRPNSTGDL